MRPIRKNFSWARFRVEVVKKLLTTAHIFVHMINVEFTPNYPPNHDRADHLANDAHGDIWPRQHVVADYLCPVEKYRCI